MGFGGSLVGVWWAALLVVGIAAVVGGVECIGTFDLVLELIALKGGVLGEVLGAANLAVFVGDLAWGELTALDDCAGEGVYLGHGWADRRLSLFLMQYRLGGSLMESGNSWFGQKTAKRGKICAVRRGIGPSLRSGSGRVEVRRGDA
jgi:hypothetical protein